ncbi:SCO family protein [bacterium]|nr:SCO family protein [bacterium]
MSELSVKTFERDFTFVEKLVRSRLFWLIFVVLGFSYPIFRSVNRVLPPTVPPMFSLPEYTFTNEYGKAFGSHELKGRFYIANFMFTTCPSTCPALLKKVQKIQKRVRGLGTKVALVSFTVDPDNDTPKVLFKTSRKYQTNPHVWTFLTSDYDSVEKLLLKGFKVPMEQMEDASVYDIAHTEKLVLVDDQGRVRSYYDSDKVGIDKLMVDLGLLINAM